MTRIILGPSFLFLRISSNESQDPKFGFASISLGHWRIALALHDVLWNPKLSIMLAFNIRVQIR